MRIYKVDQLLAREMTRKQFLVTVGLGIVGIFGFSSLIGMLTKNAENSDNGRVPYGMLNYGP
jgi:hypothetical protein